LVGVRLSRVKRERGEVETDMRGKEGRGGAGVIAREKKVWIWLNKRWKEVG